VEFRDRSDSAASGPHSGFARRLSAARRLPPVNEFNDSEADCDEKTVIVSNSLSFDDEKEAAGRKRLCSARSSLCDSEDDRLGYEELTALMRRRPTVTEQDAAGPGDVKEIRIDLSGDRSRSRSRSRTSARDHSSDEDEVDKLLRRLTSSSFNKYRNGGRTKVLAMDAETRESLKAEILGHIERLKREYERKQEAEQRAHRCLEGKYRSLKRDHRAIKMQRVLQRQKRKEVAAAPNCTTFWNWNALQRPECVPLKQPPRSAKEKKAKRRAPKKRKKKKDAGPENMDCAQ